MAIFERDGYGTICYSSSEYRAVVNKARKEFDYCIRMAKYETRMDRKSFAAAALKDAAMYRQMIVENKRDMFYAMSKGR